MNNTAIFILTFLFQALVFGQSKGTCISQSNIETVVEEILQNTRVRRYLHVDQVGRSPLKIKCTQYIKSQFEIYYNSEKALITTNENYSDLLEIYLRNVECNNSEITLIFDFYSKIEGVGITGKAVKKGKQWSIEILKEVLI
ncbi:hypothetical protein FHG64_00665 [Antarcticibacterium flavum]|uniref:Uncharacterized protein n=1 Tax=Antarcticibacterium flavum TaxID=2058175 RepID=A0A5B7WYD2_9FLAO|nr:MULTISPECIES: hypothetical protein [Antarcticibacterium]MCM4161688.1 hypothetical protein [Antarcticibacterium sp. W02-3]QCY68025.1 hypothetical protein FHG64_00665 [Antarcticibacterium flavum]